APWLANRVAGTGLQALDSLGLVAAQVLVVGLTGDPVTTAHLGHGLSAAGCFEQHLEPDLGHGHHPQPHHPPPLDHGARVWAQLRSVRDVSGTSGMCPERSVRDLSGYNTRKGQRPSATRQHFDRNSSGLGCILAIARFEGDRSAGAPGTASHGTPKEGPSVCNAPRHINSPIGGIKQEVVQKWRSYPTS